jgi:hypothetical protein
VVCIAIPPSPKTVHFSNLNAHHHSIHWRQELPLVPSPAKRLRAGEITQESEYDNRHPNAGYPLVSGACAF